MNVKEETIRFCVPFKAATGDDAGKRRVTMDKTSKKSNFTMTCKIVKRYASTDRTVTHLFTNIHESDIYSIE